jgi:hypothetical protein
MIVLRSASVRGVCRPGRGRSPKLSSPSSLKRSRWIRTFGGWLGTRWVDTDVVREMCGKTFDSFDPSRQEEAYEQAFALAQNPRGNVLLYGNYGTGKTYLEAAICNSLREVGRLFSEEF